MSAATKPIDDEGDQHDAPTSVRPAPVRDRAQMLGRLEALVATGERATHCLAALRDLPVVPEHPLRRFLDERGVSLAEGARHLGWSVRKLVYVVTWRRRPRQREAFLVASALGFESSGELFPEDDDLDEGGDPVTRHAGEETAS